MNWTLIIVLTIVISLPFIISSIAIPIYLKIYKKKKLHALPIKDKK
jgi:Tfp pilus assembly major pilin PilA